jgi:hypothetical protein
MPCTVHTDFFDDGCPECRQEYLEMKGAGEIPEDGSRYKEFTEERAKKLYEEVMLQYLKAGSSDVDAANRARAVVRKQCAIRNMPLWPWL